MPLVRSVITVVITVAFMSNYPLLRQAKLRPVTCLVCERQLRLYRHVARFPEGDPAYRVVFVQPSLEETKGTPTRLAAGAS